MEDQFCYGWTVAYFILFLILSHQQGLKLVWCMPDSSKLFWVSKETSET